jgi:ketosteroid isomerase-like protein
MKKLLMISAAVVIMILGCSMQTARPDREAGLRSLMGVDTRFAEETAKRGLEGWLSYFDENATIFPGSHAIVTGLDAVRAYYAETGFDPSGLSWTPAGSGISSSGDLGYTYGTWEMRGSSDQSADVVARGQYLTQWKKQADGSWRVVADIGNVAPPEKPNA